MAIARCLVLDPAVLLLDEPLGALDLKLREQMKVELKKLQAQVGTTFVYITHDQSEALVMSDHVAVMNKRPLRAGGHPPESLPPSPHTLRGPLRGGEQRLVRGGAPLGRGDGGDRNRLRPHLQEPGHRTAANGRQGGTLSAPGSHASSQPGDDVPHLNRFEVIVKSLLFDGANSRLLVHPVNGDTELLIALPQNRQFDYIRRDDKIEVGWDPQSGICFAAGESP